MNNLIRLLRQMNNKSYTSYKSLQGVYHFDKFDLNIDYVQGDPFATPSKFRVTVPAKKRIIDPEWLRTRSRKVAAENAFARRTGEMVRKLKSYPKGSGKSGLIFFDEPGQEVVERTALQIGADGITVCLSAGLPANGRRINAKEAEKLLSVDIPAIIEDAIFGINESLVNEAVKLADQQDAIRTEMKRNGWVAFLANGSILPRESGVSDRPLKDAHPFKSPAEDEVEIRLPHQSEAIRGMAIKKGITLITGGGYHGKSTMLKAIERGVYYHKKGDGREYVLTDPDAVKIRAEDGRQISGVDISSFISNLPYHKDTTFFHTENASGSTSQAANMIEALEAGARVLLIDEDTSATNFMVRDHRMQQLVSKDKEPITPLIDRIAQLTIDHGVSVILVIGGTGDYFSVSDTVIMMDEYVPVNVTGRARDIIKKYPVERAGEMTDQFSYSIKRIFHQETLRTRKGKRSKVQARGLHEIQMGSGTISFSFTEQLVDVSQTRMIAEILHYLERSKKLGGKSMAELLDHIESQLKQHGMDSVTTFRGQHPGDLAMPRRHEIAAVLNRLRTAKITRE